MMNTVCFDLWNTLVYCPTKENANAIIRVLGLEGKADYDIMVEHAEKTIFMDEKFSSGDFFRRFCEKHETSCTEKRIAEAVEIWESRLENARVFPEVIDVIERLKVNNSLGIISNIDESGASYMRERHGSLLGRFDAVLFSCEVGVAKPDERIFKIAVEKLKTRPEDTLMIGDFPRIDVEPALKYGMKALLIDRNGSYTGSAYKRIRNLYEVENEIKKFNTAK